VIVSGLPRSGTSMMMKMLEAGGCEIATDKVRTADEDNPEGYFELERVKALDKGGDKGWVRDIRGKVVKAISFLLKDLPDDCQYLVVFMLRDLGEIHASQNRMLERRGKPIEDSDGTRTRELYERHLQKVRHALRQAANFEFLEVEYRAVIDDPRSQARRVNDFLGGRLDVERMVGVVDENLYRNRKRAAEGRTENET
jgi:hypothetical protein